MFTLLSAHDLGLWGKMTEGDDDNKPNLVVSVFAREFRLFTYQIVLILFLASCFLFIIYYTWMLFLSWFLLSWLNFSSSLFSTPRILRFRFGHELERSFSLSLQNLESSVGVCSMRLSRHQAPYVKLLPAFSRAVVFKLEHA